ncbi:MAG: RNA-binding protein [Ruminococcus sp.]|nr:RNA-binding protein [Ruminococcus sp.]
MADGTSSAEDRLFLSRICDMVMLAEKRGAVYSSFLNAAECSAAEKELKRLMCENYCFYGAFENAERNILCVYKEYFQPESSDFPLELVTFKFRQGSRLSHRDFLGALMALGIKRETLGDIVIDDGVAQIAVSRTVKDVITSEITKIGNSGVKYDEKYPGLLKKLQNFKELSGTAASLRLDAVVGLALNLSRGKVSGIIKGIGVEVNSSLKYDCSYALSEGDIFSVRGYGKYVLKTVSGMTKKGRIHVTVLKYC